MQKFLALTKKTVIKIFYKQRSMLQMNVKTKFCLEKEEKNQK